MMVVSRFFGAEAKGVHQTALLLGFASFLNGAFGLFRDRLLAAHFGASRVLDIYYAAFRVPDMIFTCSLFFVATTAFIPLFLEHKKRSEKEARQFLNSVFTLFFAAIACLIAITYLALPWLTHFVVPGFDTEAQNMTLFLSRVMLLSPLLLGVSSLISGVVQATRRFFAFALAPIVYNAGIVFGIVFLVPRFGLPGLAYGVVLGALLHILIQVPTLVHLGFVPRFEIHREVQPFAIFLFSFPRALALSLNQATLFALTALASTLSIGSIAIFNLSYNLFALPITVIGLSYSIAAFPGMTELALEKDTSAFYEYSLVSLRHIFFWTLPVSALFIVLRAHIVRLVLGVGAFTWVNTKLTIASLLLFSFAIVTQSIVTLFVRAYHAIGKPRQTIVYNLVASVATIVAAFFVVEILRVSTTAHDLFGALFRVADIEHRELLALPFAYSVGSLVNAMLLGKNLFRSHGREVMRELKTSIVNITFVSVGMAFVAYIVLRLLSFFVVLDTFIAVLLEAALACIIAGGAGIVLCKLLKVQEFFHIQKAFKARFQRADVIRPEAEHLS